MSTEINAVDFSTESLRVSSAQVILVAGPSGSGKSTIAEQISKVFDYPVVSLDAFFLDEVDVPIEKLSDGAQAHQWESPAAIDIDYANAFLRELVQTGSGLLPKYSYKDNKRLSLNPFSISSKNFVLEGLNAFFFSGLLADLGLKTFKIFVDTNLEERDAVIKKRDALERKKENKFDERIRILRLGEKRWVYAQRGDADLVLFRNMV